MRRLYKIEVQGNFITYWSEDSDRDIKSYRVSNDPEINRTVDCVPLIELMNAVEDAVKINGSLPVEVANQAIGRTLGYNRTGSKINEILDEAVKMAISDGRIKELNGRLVLEE